MMNSYFREHRWSRRLRQLGLAALLLGSAAGAARAQALNYTTTSATNTTTTYSDLGGTGTPITTATTDDANSAAQNIGFTFTYNGTDFTKFVLNTNGLIRLGDAPPSAANMFANYVRGQQPGIPPVESPRPADTNLLIPFNFDLESGTGAGGATYSVATTGTAPNQVCTIQWKNVHDKADSTVAAQYGSFNFQVKLYQTTNVIEFVYDAATAATVGAEAARYPTVGIKGSGSSSGQDVLANKTTSGLTWDKTVFITGQYQTSTHNFRRTVGPDAGRTYRFTPVVIPPDAGVLAVYTLPQLPIPLATPHVVRAAISNNGGSTFTNLVATLTVTGANPFTTTATIPSLPFGQTTVVSFPGFSPTVLGTNTLTVSIPNNDNDPSNNSLSASQQTTTNTYSYIRAGVSASNGVGNDTTGALFVGRFSAQTSTTVNSVTVFITDYSSNPTVGRTLFGVVTDPTTGAILGRSAGTVITAADVNTYKTFPITAVGTTTPLTVPAGDFLAGLGQPAYKGTQFYPIGLQDETPTRPGSFYIESPRGGVPQDLSSLNFGSYMITVDAGAVPSCLPPTGAAFTATTGSSIQVTFTGGTTAPASYTVIYGLAGFDPTTAGTTITSATLPITISGLTPNAVYQLFVRANCSATSSSSLSGPYQFQTGCAATTTITAFPYFNNFDNIIAGQSLPCGFTVLDVNNDKATWSLNRTAPYSGTNAVRYTSAINNSVAADDWLFTPGLATAANTRYQVAFRYRGEGIANATSPYTEKLEVKVGPAATVAGQTTTLYTNPAITNTSYALANATSTPAVAVFTPGAGTQYVGFHVYSAATQGNLYIDDLSITASVVTATSSAALLRAVTVFPNPSATGLFDLEIHGAQAKGSLGVQVTNTLGQLVYTGSARDNYTNRLDLSGLAPGIYHLQIRNGDETMTRQLAIVK